MKLIRSTTQKKDGSWQFCGYYRQLNTVTLQDAYPLPWIDDILDALAGNRYFNTLNLTSGYWQVPMDKEAQERGTFTTRWGLRVFPFGLTSAPATVQRLMERMLLGLRWKTLLLYLADIILIAPDYDTNTAQLQQVLSRLRTTKLKLKPCKASVNYCRLKSTNTDMWWGWKGSPRTPAKWQQYRTGLPLATYLKQLRAFLGTKGYYHNHVQDVSQCLNPWHQTPLENKPAYGMRKPSKHFKKWSDN